MIIVIIVLSTSDKKFEEYKESTEYIQVDLGYTEVKVGTETVLGVVE